MRIQRLFAIGVLASLACCHATIATDSERASTIVGIQPRVPSTPGLPWSKTVALTPIDLCIFGGRNFCPNRTDDEASESHLKPSSPSIPTVRIEPLPTISRSPKTTLVILSSCVYVAAWIDMHRTYPRRRVITERDPFVRPLLKLPAPAYYATGLALATGINYLGWKMAHSRRFRKIWFIPQAFTIAGNTWGRATSTDSLRSSSSRP